MKPAVLCRVLLDDVARKIVSKPFRYLHETFGMIEDETWKGQLLAQLPIERSIATVSFIPLCELRPENL